MYGKIFESMYEGTLYGQWEAIVTMQQLIVLANEDGVIDMTPPAIAGKTSIPLEIIEKGLETLSKPDPYSRTPGHDGIRIELMDEHRPWGWQIVNYLKYRDMVRREDKKEADRKRIAEKRKSNKINNVAECRKESQSVANVAHTDTDTDTDTDIKPLARETYVSAPRRTKPKKIKFTDAFSNYAMGKGMSADEMQTEWQKFSEWEFKSTKTDWLRAWQRWCRTWQERKPKQPEELMFGAFDD